MTFEMWVPFQLQPQYTLSSSGSAAIVPNTEAKVTLESKGSRYNLRIDGLNAQEDASRWMPRAFTGLTALMLDVKSSVTASWTLTPAIPVTKPLPATGLKGLPQFDTIGDEARPFVVESGQKVGVFVGHASTITVTASLQRAAQAIARGMKAPNADQLFNDERFPVQPWNCSHPQHSRSRRALGCLPMPWRWKSWHPPPTSTR